MDFPDNRKNKFFTLDEEGKNRYYIEDFDAEETKGLNNVYLLSKEVKNNSVVLDVGCGQGRFGKILKKKGCKIYGAELDPLAAQCAMNTEAYEKVFVMDITNEKSSEYVEFNKSIEHVDAIILSDILEHVTDPTRLLVNCSEILKEDGIILISVPNIAHMYIILNLMNDKFTYEDMGILDNTHFKFFTKTSFVEWIEQINNTFNKIYFDCEYLGATFYNNDVLNYVKDNYNELFRILEQSKNYNALEILFKLKKVNTKKECNNLEILLQEKKCNVVDSLGSALNGKLDKIKNGSPVEGERIWYEENLNWYKNRVQQLENAVEWHRKNEENVKQSLEWHIDKVEQLEGAIEYHHNLDEQLQQSIDYEKAQKEIANNELEKNKSELEKKKSEIENIKNEADEKIKQQKDQILKLRNTIFTMENSRSWRWTRFFRKKK